jgi:acyl carrier protein
MATRAKGRIMAILDDVRGVLRETLGLGERARHLELSTPLLGSLPELDSIAVVTVIAGIEDRFGIAVEDDDISAETFDTVGSLCKFIEHKRRT